VATSKEHNDGGANCFISNDISHFTSYITKALHVKQLNGTTVKALGYGLKLIQCSITNTIIPLWPTYYIPTNLQCTFSPTALQHYLHYKIITEHLDSLLITTSTGITLRFPSLQQHSNQQILDYHEFYVVKPKTLHKPSKSPSAIANSATSESPLSCLLVHQHLGHNCDEVLDIMCCRQSLLGLPKQPFPPRKCPCIICITTKTVHPPRTKITSVTLTKRGQLLHIDFSFWNIVSIRGFTSLLLVIDGKDRMIWNFPTASKRCPLQILDYLFAMLQHDGITV
jgi:hypothetical protein